MLRPLTWAASQPERRCCRPLLGAGARRPDAPCAGLLRGAMPKSTVKLVSAEGYEFIVDYKAACVSNTIRNMLSSQGRPGWAGGGFGAHTLVRACTHVCVCVRRGGRAACVAAGQGKRHTAPYRCGWNVGHMPHRSARLPAPGLGFGHAGSFTETELGEVKFPEISTPILEKVGVHGGGGDGLDTAGGGTVGATQGTWLDGPGAGSRHRLRFQHTCDTYRLSQRARVYLQVCQYFYYKLRYQNS